MALQHLRSGVANKRPIPTIMSEGQIALNTNEASPGLFFKDSNDDLVKIGPVHIGTSAPNSSPASTAATALVTGATYQILTVGTSDFTLVGASANTVGVIFTATGTTTGTGTVSGQQGVEKGEQWLDTTGGNYVLKIYDGTAWRSEAGEFVNVTGDTMTGALLLDNAASASAPDLSFDGDANTGVYSPGADQFGVATGGTAALTIDASQRVGIGTTSPGNFNTAASKLVVGTGSAPQGLTIYTGTTNNGSVYFADGTTGTDDRSGAIIYDHSGDNFRFHTAATERVRIDSSGRLGVGTTSADRLLHVEGAGTSGTQVQIEGTSASAGLKFVPASGDNWELQATTDSALLVYNRTDAAERMRIDSSGRLLVGTTTEGQTNADNLTIADSGNCGLTIRSATTGSGNIYFSDATSGTGEYSGGVLYSHADDRMMLYTASTERLRIDSSGRLLVGTSSTSADCNSVFVGSSTSATSIIHLGRSSSVSNGSSLGAVAFGDSSQNTYAQISANADAVPGASDYPGRLVFSTTSSGASSPTERMRIDSAGRLLVGTTSGASGRLIHIDGGSSSAYFHSTNTLTGSGSSDGLIVGMGSAKDAYVWNYEAGFLEFGTNGQSRISIDSSGNVGIGTTSPAWPLDVNGIAKVKNAVLFEATNSTNRWDVYTYTDNTLRFNYNGSGSDEITIDSSGNVGIGNTLPSAKLQIEGTSDQLKLTYTSIASYIHEVHSNGDYSIAKDSNERMRIDSSGRLLVGTSSQSKDSTVVLEGSALSGSNNESGIWMQRGSSSPADGNALGRIVFSDNTGEGSAQIRAHRDGGTWSGSSKPGRLVFSTTADGASSPTERMRISSTGAVSTWNFGSGSTAGAIYTRGRGALQGTSATSYGNLINFNWTAGAAFEAWVDTSKIGNLSYTSDYRIKRNIQTQTSSGIDRIKLLRPVTYNLADFTLDGTQLSSQDDVVHEGFIAHEVGEVIADGCNGTKDSENELQSLNLSAITSVLTKALQEAIAKIENLEQRLSDAGIA